jgi:exonuclease SbcC
MSVEILYSLLEEIEQELSSLRTDKEASARSLMTDEKRMDSLGSENRCPLCLQPLGNEYKEQLLRRIQQENAERRTTMEADQKEIEVLQRKRNIVNEVYSSLQTLKLKKEDAANRICEEKENLKSLSADFEEKKKLGEEFEGQLNFVRTEISRFNLADLEFARTHREQAFRQYYVAESDLRTKENQRKVLLTRMDDIKERVDNAQQKLERMEKIGKIIEVINSIRDAYRSIQPRIRSEFVRVLRNFVQQVIDSLAGETPLLNVTIDETYTPYVKSESAAEREVSNLSGGERTLLAFAYRLGLGQLIMQSRTGHGLSILLLDEPTESLGREDGSIDRLADAISRFKAIEQIIAVTHSEAFADKAEHVITLEKEAGISRVSIGT